MPYDERGFFYGPDAFTPGDATQTRFIGYVTTKLNDPDGDYRSIIGKDVVVTSNREKGAAAFRAGSPSIRVLQGKGEASTWGKKIEDVTYDGARHELTFEIDLAAAKEVASDGPPEDETTADNRLVGMLETVVRRGMNDLDALGLFNLSIEHDEERQRRGEERNPLLVTFFTRVLYGYAGG